MISEKDNNPENKFEHHWNKVYRKNEIYKLGWFEDSPVPSLQLIKKCNLAKNAHLLNVGAGATTLVDELLDLGYNNVIANDLSSAALGKLKERLGERKSEKVHWVVDDLTASNSLYKIEKVDLWHDRAVLHFFTEESEQDAYFELLKKLVKNNGHVIIAAFNLKSATKCSGLPINRFDENLLQEKLGEDFELIEAFNHTYTMPSGDTRKYVYTLFSRVA
ncbi:MAG: class I SAM-dependent methyltransferase [Bacteroidota bacterium]